jgi:hypothetical protein
MMYSVCSKDAATWRSICRVSMPFSFHHSCFNDRVSLFRFKTKMRNEAKQREKDAKQNSKLARLSENKQNKVRMTQFRLHAPSKPF